LNSSDQHQPDQENIHAYVPMTSREIRRIRRSGFIRAFGGFLGAILPLLSLSCLAFLAPLVMQRSPWPSAVMAIAMLLLADVVLLQRKISWFRHNLTMMMVGSAAFFMLPPSVYQGILSARSPLVEQGFVAALCLVGGVVFCLIVQRLAFYALLQVQRASLFKKDPLTPEQLHEDLNRHGITAFDAFFTLLEESGRSYMVRAEVLAIVAVLRHRQAETQHAESLRHP
jgi:hypothetical protein